MISNYKINTLFELIKSLSSTDKRNFRLYVNRIKHNQNAKFMKLFDIIIKMKIYNEKYILQKTPITKIQFANIKAYLYKQILMSLRLHNEYNLYLKIREFFDFSYILYNKGLYIQSIKYLNKAKIIAKKYSLNIVLLEILEFEKKILNDNTLLNIDIDNDYEFMINYSNKIIDKLKYKHYFLTLSLKLYQLFINIGYIKNDKDKFYLKCCFRKNLPSFNLKKLGFYEKLSLYKCRFWYYYISQNFIMCYKVSITWIKLFESYPYIKNIFFINYVKGYRYLLNILFYLKKYSDFMHNFKLFKNIILINKTILDDNTNILVFVCKYINLIHIHFMEGTFSIGVKLLLPNLFEEFSKFKSRLDNYYIMLLYYKIAFLYFGNGNYNLSIKFLSKIIHHQNLILTKDFQSFVRLLYLISCYEAGLYESLSYSIKSIYKFYIKINYYSKIQKIIVDFINNLRHLYPHQIKDQFKKLKNFLLPYTNHPYEKIIFLYLDIISWISSKIENKSIELIVREKFLKKTF